MMKFGVAFLLAVSGGMAQQSAQTLADILEQKGLIGTADRARVRLAGNEDGVQLLTAILRERGLLNQEEVARIVPLAPPARSELAAASILPPPPRTQAPPAERIPVSARIPIQLYGTILLNSFYNTSLNNNQDVPSFGGKQGTDATGGDKNYGMTARQSRFGMTYTGPQVAGARLSGQAEMDFLAGNGTVPNGADYFVPRMRLAFGRLDWKDISLEAGQDWSIFAPLNPVSLASYGVASLNASGNLWVREPQIRAEFRQSFSNKAKLLYQFAATDPNLGDNSATFNSLRLAGIGERGRMPGLESRVSYSNNTLAFGLSARYGRGKNSGTVGMQNLQTGVDSWGVAGDWSIPAGKWLTFTGEAYAGRALGAYGGSLGQGVLPVGTVGQNGVNTRGGWLQAQANFTPRWQTNLAYGIEIPDANQLTLGLRDKNQTYSGNLMYKWSPNITLAWEWRKFLNNFRSQQMNNERGDQFNMAIAFAF